MIDHKNKMSYKSLAIVSTLFFSGLIGSINYLNYDMVRGLTNKGKSRETIESLFFPGNLYSELMELNPHAKKSLRDKIIFRTLDFGTSTLGLVGKPGREIYYLNHKDKNEDTQ